MALDAVLFPLMWLSNHLGLGPFGTWKNGRLYPKSTYKINSIIVLIVLSSLEALILLDFSGTTSGAISLSTDLIDTYGFAITCIGSFVTHNLLGKHLRDLFNALIELNMHTYFSTTRFIVDIVFCIIYEASFSFMSLVEPFEYTNYNYYVIETMTYVALEMYSYLIFLQFIYLVLACKAAFATINIKLLKLVSEIKACHQNLNRARCFLKKMASEYSRVVSVTRSVNDLFAMQNILCVILSFLEITYASYNGVSGIFVRGHSDDSRPSKVLADLALWAGYFMYKLLAVLIVCSDTIHESKKTIDVIHKITLESDDSLLNNEVEYFSLQLLHDKPVFGPLGFFSFDMTLMYSVITVATGYLIILIQFGISRPSQKNLNATSDGSIT